MWEWWKKGERRVGRMSGANILCQPFPREKKAVIVNDAFYGREEMPSSHELWPLMWALARVLAT